MNKQTNPWLRKAPAGWPSNEIQLCNADERRQEIKTIDDPEKLRAIIAWPDSQTTVRAAAQARLLKLEKLSAALLKAQAADGKYVLIRKSDRRYLAPGADGKPVWKMKLSDAWFYHSLGAAIGAAQGFGRDCRVAKIEGGMLGATVWN